MDTLRRVLAVVVASSLVSDLDLIGDYNTTTWVVASRRRWECLQTLHPNLVHHSFLTLAKCQVDSDRVRTRGTAPIAAGRIATATTHASIIIFWRFVCLLRRAKRIAEQYGEPRFDELECHREIGHDYRNESLPGAPFTSKLCTIDRVLSKRQN